MSQWPRSAPCSRSLRSGLLVLVALLALALAGSASAKNASDYENLTPRTRTYFVFDPKDFPNDIEFYEVQSTPKTVGGVEATVVKTVHGPDDGTETWYTNDDQGLRVHGLMIPNGTDPLEVVYETPLVILGKTFDLGSTFSTSTTVNAVGKARLQLRVDHLSSVLAFETLDTPFGDLDTVKLQRDITVFHRPGTPDELEQERTVWVWMAKGIGPVQALICDNRRNCNNRLNNDNPDHTQFATFTTKTFVPEPAAGLAPAAGLLVLAVLARFRSSRVERVAQA